MSPTAVCNARKLRNIKALNPTPKYNIDWDQIPLGKYLDEHLANMLGCTYGLVNKERVKRNIPPYGMTYRTFENQGAYYGEAIIDAWLHKQNIPHTFQKQIGPYRVDWVLDKNVIWEFVGMWDHKLYGEDYRNNFYNKKAYLEYNGFTVRAIHQKELNDFKKDIDLKLLYSFGHFVCSGCNRNNVKHVAHGLCSACYIRNKTKNKLEDNLQNVFNKSLKIKVNKIVNF